MVVSLFSRLKSMRGFIHSLFGEGQRKPESRPCARSGHDTDLPPVPFNDCFADVEAKIFLDSPVRPIVQPGMCFRPEVVCLHEEEQVNQVVKTVSTQEASQFVAALLSTFGLRK
jgi:hypothetical protein